MSPELRDAARGGRGCVRAPQEGVANQGTGASFAIKDCRAGVQVTASFYCLG